SSGSICLHFCAGMVYLLAASWVMHFLQIRRWGERLEPAPVFSRGTSRGESSICRWNRRFRSLAVCLSASARRKVIEAAFTSSRRPFLVVIVLRPRNVRLESIGILCVGLPW